MYKVWVDESTAPAGFIPSTATWALVWLSSGQDVTDVNFGNMTPEQPTGTIPGNKFEDSNWDGEHDEGEPGLPGFDFTVADQSDPNTILDTMTSDADGSFAFDNLPPGTYIVKEVTPSAESNYHQTGQTEWIVPLTAGETAGPVTFLNAPHCNVIGTKYIDSDASGNISGNDATYPGLPIALTGININGESVSLSTSTDANGDYAFTDLMAGNYTVTEDLSATTLTPILGPSLPANPAPLENLEVNFLNSNDVEVSPEGPITPETPTSVEPVGLGDSTPAVSESVSAETLPGTGMNELPLLLIAGFLMLAGILFLAFGVFRRRKLA